ncbi:MAG: 1-deoxy-D-xylulose-5-phosphate reductoisomerase [Thermomicrobiaceae bacterium]
MTTRLAILGSTGSIGRQTLDIVRTLPEHFSVVALAAGSNLDLLDQQVREFSPDMVSTTTPCDPQRYAQCDVLRNDEGLSAVATHPEADIVVIATSGHSAIRPTLEALYAGKEIALANKEVVVCAGEILMQAARECRTEIRPVDSEHSAIWQCLKARGGTDDVERITLTASGGALRDLPLGDLPAVTVDQALNHPNWAMGPKVTIDSATLMNKGLEVIEAHWLFGIEYDRIDVVIHPQSLIHSMVTYSDGSTLAQLGVPDMRVPIQYALTHPNRIASPDRHLKLSELGILEFREPDRHRFPALELAYQAGRSGSTYPTVLSAADDAAVDAFLQNRIKFGDITALVERVVSQHQPETSPLTLDSIQHADEWARGYAKTLIAQLQ